MSWPDFPLHFLRPWWWLALAPLPLVLWLVARAGGGRSALARLADASLLPHLVHDAGARRRVALVLLAATWLLAVAALAGPAWQKVATPLYVNGAARVVVLSLSRDMLAQDLKPDRITRARFAVRDLLDASGDARTALVAYAGAAFTVAPLTDDKRTIENLLHALAPDVMPVPGNDGAAGIRKGVQLLQQAHTDGGDIVLVTDTAGTDAVKAASVAHRSGIRVDVLGIGTPDGAPVPQRGGGFAAGAGGTVLARRDDAALRAVAQAGGGRYAVLQADGSGAASLGPPRAQTGHVSHGEQAQLWRDGGVWLLPLLAVLAALAFRRGWLLALALVALPPAMPAAHAADWQSLWANRDQRALQALQRGDAGTARALAESPALGAAADYRAGDYAAAAKAFAAGRGARARYNLGNALAKQGKYPEAIDAYRQALKLDPGFADARANLEAVQAWMRKHPQPPSQGSKQGKQGKQPGQDGSQSGSGTTSSQGQPGRQPGANGNAAPATSSAGSAGDKSNAAPTAGKGQQGSGSTSPEQGAASPSEDARQRSQASEAKQGLQQELGRHRGKAPAPGSSTAPAFALGQPGSDDDDSKFSARQRALLHAVPDDPGALLRNKFLLEWQQRQRRQEGDGS